MINALDGNEAAIVAFPETGNHGLYMQTSLFFQKALFSDALAALKKHARSNSL
jgi:hypothetical protein